MASWGTVTKKGNGIRGVPDGKAHPEQFSEGDVVTGHLADVFIKEGWAKAGKGNPPENTNLPVTATKPTPKNSAEQNRLKTENSGLKKQVAELFGKLKSLQEQVESNSEQESQTAGHVRSLLTTFGSSPEFINDLLSGTIEDQEVQAAIKEIRVKRDEAQEGLSRLAKLEAEQPDSNKDGQGK